MFETPCPVAICPHLCTSDCIDVLTSVARGRCDGAEDAEALAGGHEPRSQELL